MSRGVLSEPRVTSSAKTKPPWHDQYRLIWKARTGVLPLNGRAAGDFRRVAVSENELSDGLRGPSQSRCAVGVHRGTPVVPT